MSFFITLLLLCGSPLLAQESFPQHLSVLSYLNCSNAFSISDQPSPVNPNRNLRVGHIVQLSFPSINLQLKKDFFLVNPENTSEKIEVVGSVAGIEWRGGSADSMFISSRFSSQNRALFQEALTSLDSDPEVQIELVIYEYDLHSGTFFKRFHTFKKPLSCALQSDRDIYIAPDPESVDSYSNQNVYPIRFECAFYLVPKHAPDNKIGYAFRSDGIQFVR